MAEGSVRRFLIAAGTGEYEHAEPLEQVPTDIRTITGLFGALGYEQAFPGGILDPAGPEALKTQINEWLRERDNEDYALILYYSGHGERYGLRHYLYCKNTVPGELDVNGLATEDLIRIAASRNVRRMLLIVDACHAGQGGVVAIREFAELLNARLAAAAGDAVPAMGIFSVIVAARAKETARDGEFARALQIAVKDKKLRGQRPPYLSIDDLVNRVNQEFASRGILQHADSSRVGQDPAFGFIPNPDYVRDLSPEGTDLAEQRTWASPQARMRREELAVHFSPRGRGSALGAEAGHFFTGRVEILSVLARWLRRESDADGQIIFLTGAAGTGKSAVLGRLVVRSNPGTRATIPEETVPQSTDVPVETISIAIHARRKTVEDIMVALADFVRPASASLGPQTIDELVETLTAYSRPITIVVDAVDEAGSVDGDQTEARRIAGLLCAVGDRVPEAHVLVGARPQIRKYFEQAATIYDLNDTRWLRYRDIGDYAEQLLQTPHGPGSVGCYSPVTANAVGGAIGRRAYPNYLVARLTARALAIQEQPVDTTEAGWEDLLPVAIDEARRLADPVADAFRWALRQQLGTESTRAHTLLRPLAFAEGSGLPWHDTWSRLASALSDQVVTDDDIEWVLMACAQYIVEGLDEHGRSVYRLYHESLAEYLHEGAPPDAAARITDALSVGVPRLPDGIGPDWERADPYVLTHLATHARNTELLDSLINDSEYLVHATPYTLIPCLGGVRGAKTERAVAVYRASAHMHLWLDPAERRQVLAVDAMRYGYESLANSLSRPPGRPAEQWCLAWATGTNVNSSLASTFSANTAQVHAVAVGRKDDRVIIFAGDRAGNITVSDLSTETVIDDYIEVHDGWVEGLAAISIGGDELVVSVGTDGAVCVLSATSFAVIATTEVNGKIPLRAVSCARVGGRALAVVGGDDGALWVLSLPNLSRIGEALVAHPRSSGMNPFGGMDGGVCAIACTMLDKRPIAISVGGRLVINVWDLAARALIGTINGGGTFGQTIWTVDCIKLDGRTVAVTGDNEGWIRVWDLDSRRERRELSLHHATSRSRQGVHALKCFQLNGRACVISCAGDTAQVWDLALGKVISGPMRADTNQARAVDCIRVLRSPVAITGGDDHVVRVWRLRTRKESPRLSGHSSPVHSLIFTGWDRTAVLISAAFSDTILAHDAVSGRLEAAMVTECGDVNAIAYTQVSGDGVMVIATEDGSLQTWDVTVASRIAGPVGVKSIYTDIYDQEICAVHAMACTSLEGRHVVVTGGGDGTVRLWDLMTLGEIGRPLVGHRDWVTAVACTKLDGRPIAVTGGQDKTVRLWDLAARSEFGVLQGAGAWVTSVATAVIKDTAVAVTGDYSGMAALWNLRDQRIIARWPAVESGRLGVVKFMPGSLGRILLTGGGDGYLRWWDLKDGHVFHRMRFPGEIRNIAFGPPGKLAVAFSRDVAILSRDMTPERRLLWVIDYVQ